MANNLHKLYLIIGKTEYLNIARKMLHPITREFPNYPMAYANWGTFMLKITAPYYEVAILGIDAETVLREMQSGFHPNILFVFSKSESNIPILKERTVSGKTLIYICKEGVCQLPVESAKQAMELLR